MIDEFGMAADTTKKVNPTPKPEPKPIELKEVVIKSGPWKGWVAVGTPDIFGNIRHRLPQAVIEANRAEAWGFLRRWTPAGRTVGAIIATLNILEMTNNMSQSKNDKSDELPAGFKETNEFGKPHGQKVYKKGNKYYSKDADGHNGGKWKVFEKQGTKLKRVGTADKDLNIFKK